MSDRELLISVAGETSALKELLESRLEALEERMDKNESRTESINTRTLLMVGGLIVLEFVIPIAAAIHLHK